MELDFTQKGYMIMSAIWFGAGCMGGILAARQKRNILLWFLLCLAAPVALFFLAGGHARLEAAKDKAAAAAREAGQDGHENG